MTNRQATPRSDGATEALEDLIAELTVCIDGLGQALQRAEQLRQQRRSGQSWLDIVSTETRPLIVERVTQALESLNTKGGRWRREQACALLDEGVSINRIAAMFGVSRQRISTLVRKRNADVSQIGQPDQVHAGPAASRLDHANGSLPIEQGKTTVGPTGQDHTV